MGREPTSANCHTCRIRRIRCDKTKPACKRCQKSNLTCQGYEKILRVQSHGVVRDSESGSSHIAKFNETNSYPTSSATYHTDTSHYFPVSSGKRCRKSKPTSSHDSLPLPGTTYTSSPLKLPPAHSHRPPVLPRIDPWPELNLAAFIDNVTFSYFFDAYSWINVHSILLQDTPMRHYLAQQSDELSYRCLRALTYGIFGRDHHVEALQLSAARAYGASLQELQLRLSTSSKQNLALLIKPVSILGSYSITIDDDLRFTHHHGLQKILEHCGPDSFRDPSLLPMFESCRMTLIGSATVRRRTTFLEQREWRTDPWLLCPESKTNSSKLLDIMARVPGIIQGTDDVLDERSQSAANPTNISRKETSSTVPDLQRRLEQIFSDLAMWRSVWELENSPTSSNVLNWALCGTGDDSYRPGIFGAYGPDVYGLNMSNIANLDTSFTSATSSVSEPVANTTTFVLMQDAALYITVLIWAGRLHKNLTGAAKASDAIDFYNAPFYTRCHCYYNSPGPLRRCQIFPPPHDHVESTLSWNVNASKISEAPVRMLCGDIGYVNNELSALGVAPYRKDDMTISSSPSITESTPHLQSGELLLPGDVRFSAQLRILNWLVKHLSNSRRYVLGTLAAMGLSHCVHDVRPLEGNEFIAETIRQTMVRSRFEGAADLLIRSYR